MGDGHHNTEEDMEDGEAAVCFHKCGQRGSSPALILPNLNSLAVLPSRHQLAVRGDLPLRGGTIQPPERVGAQPVMLRQKPAVEDHGDAAVLP